MARLRSPREGATCTTLGPIFPAAVSHILDAMELRVEEQRLRESGICLLVAFGSRTEGKERPKSDLDLGVCYEPGLGRDLIDTISIVTEALSVVDTELDIVDLDRADPLLLFEVASRGRPVFESKPGSFEEFRIRAIKRYYDTAWIRRLERDVLRARYG